VGWRALADHALFVLTKTRDVCFTGSLVEHQVSMSKPTGMPYVAAMIFFQHLVAMKIPQSTCSPPAPPL